MHRRESTRTALVLFLAACALGLLALATTHAASAQQGDKRYYSLSITDSEARPNNAAIAPGLAQEATRTGCWRLSSFGEGTPDSDGNIQPWGWIDGNGNVTGGCRVKMQTEAGLTFVTGSVTGKYNSISGRITDLRIDTTEILTTTVDGKVWSVGKKTLSLWGNLPLEKEDSYEESYRGEVDFAYTRDTGDKLDGKVGLLIRIQPAANKQTVSAWMQVQLGGRTTQVSPGQGATVTLGPGQNARVSGKCDNMLDAFLLWTVYYGDPKYWIDIPGTKATIDVRLLIVYMKCLELEKKNPKPGQMAPLRRPLAQEMPVQATVEMVQGPVRVVTAFDDLALTVESADVSVSVQGKNDFEVVYNQVSGQSTVLVYEGTADVKPWNTDLQPVTLQAGQQVQVSAAGVGPVTAAAPPAKVSSGTSLSIPGGMTTVGLCSCGGLLLVAAVVAGVIVLSRRSRRQAGPPRPRSQTDKTQLSTYPPPVPPTYPPVGARPAGSGARLVVVGGGGGSTPFSLSAQGVVIGRGRSSGLSLDDPLASRQHARVELAGGAWVISDLGSRNGTYVNGRRITRQALRPRDQIQIGQTILTFEL